MVMARKIDRLVKQLAEEHRWALLRAVVDKRVSLRRLYAAFVTDPTLRKLETDLATPDVVPLIVEFLKDRDAKLGKRKSGPRAEYTLAIKRFTGVHCPASHLTTDAIDAWVGRQPGSSTYRHNALLRLSSFCQFLVRRKVLATNPVREVERPKRRKLAPVYESAAVDENIVKRAEGVYVAIFALIHGSGADVSAALDMTAAQLNLKGFTFHGIPGWGLAHVPGTKTDKRDRHEVRIEPWAVPYLRIYTKHMLPGAPLFEGVTRYMAAWHHKRVAKDAGKPGYTLRHARHSWAIRARQERGETWEQIGEQLGTSPYVVSKHYAAFKPREVSLADEQQVEAAQ